MERLNGILVAFLLSTCGSTGIIRPDVDERAYLELAKQKQFACVGEIRADSSTIASCVLVAKQYILTAAHVFQHAIPVRGSGGDSVMMHHISNGSKELAAMRVIIARDTVPISRYIIHPNFDAWNIFRFDVAVVELGRPLSDVDPAVLNVEPDELYADVVGVGYGVMYAAGATEPAARRQQKHAGENTVDEIWFNGMMLMYDFDHPNDPLYSRMGSATPRPLEYIPSHGDSGGGLFRMRHDVWELVGIQTDLIRMDGDHASGSVSWTGSGMVAGAMRISMIAEWVNRQVHGGADHRE